MSRNKKVVIQVIVFGMAMIMMKYGADRGETGIVFTKAVNICLECIGLG